MIGRKIHVGIGKETTRGAAVNPGFWIPKYEVTIDNKKEYLNNEQSIGVIADTDGSTIVKEWSEGEITGKIRDDSFGLFLLSALGTVSSAVKETTAYNHTFSFTNTNTHQSLTIEMKDDVEQLAYPLAVIESLKITAEVGKFVEFSAGFQAKKGATANNTPSYTTSNEFVAKHAEIKFASSLAGLDAATATTMKSVEISIDKNVEADDVLGSNEPNGYYNKQMSIEINVEALFTNDTLKGYFEDRTNRAMRIDLVNDDVTIGGSSNPRIQIDIPKVAFQEWERAGANDELVSQSVKLKAHYSQSDSKFIDIILTNEETSY